MNEHYHNSCMYSIREGDLEGVQRAWPKIAVWSRIPRSNRYNYLVTALETTFNEDVWEWITEKDPDSVDREIYLPGGDAPLMRFAKRRDASVFLIKHGANVRAHTRYGESVLHRFCQHRESDLLPLLQNGANETILDMDDVSPLTFATRHKHPQLPVLLNFRKLLVVAHTRDEGALTLPIELVRLLRPFLYNL